MSRKIEKRTRRKRPSVKRSFRSRVFRMSAGEEIPVPKISNIKDEKKRKTIQERFSGLDSTQLLVDGKPEFAIPIYHYDTPYLEKWMKKYRDEYTRNEPWESPITEWFSALFNYVNSKTVTRGENKYILDKDWYVIFE